MHAYRTPDQPSADAAPGTTVNACSNALQNGTSRKSFVSGMAHATSGQADPGVREGIRCDPGWQCLLVGHLVELAATTNVDRHGLPVCRPAQLVRAALFSDAFAGEVRALAKFLRRGVRGYLLSHGRLYFIAGALLHKSLVGPELADCDRRVEYLHVAVDRRVDYFARAAEFPPRL